MIRFSVANEIIFPLSHPVPFSLPLRYSGGETKRPFPFTSFFRWETRENPVNQLGARLKLGNCRASNDTASTFLDSRTATEPVISSRLLLPPLRNLHPLYRSLVPPRIVCRVVLQPSVVAECNATASAEAVVVTGQSRMHACRCKRR